jgi:hypothetical protein
MTVRAKNVIMVRGKPHRRRPLNLPVDLDNRLELVAADLGCSMNAYVVRVLARALKNHIPLDTYLNAGPERGSGKNRHTVEAPALSRYDTTTCHPCGWPLHLPAGFWKMGEPENKVENLRAALQADRTYARAELNAARTAALLPAVTDDQWAETKAWFAANPAGV